jgi:hypothetical protein
MQDPDSLEMQDPDPYLDTMNPDPQHCGKLSKNFATDLSDSTIFIDRYLSYAAELSASWQHLPLPRLRLQKALQEADLLPHLLLQLRHASNFL